MANVLGNLGRYDAALAIARDAVETRASAHTRPDEFLPELASSLLNVGTYLGALGQTDAAVKATAEGVHGLRRVASVQQDALPWLANVRDASTLVETVAAVRAFIEAPLAAAVGRSPAPKSWRAGSSWQ